METRMISLPMVGNVAQAIDKQIKMLEQAKKNIVTEIDAEVVKLKRARLALAPSRQRAARKRTTRSANGSGPKDAAKIAGPAVIAAVKSVLGDQPEGLRQSQIVEQTGKNSGSVSYAIRALVEAGAVERDGRMVRLVRERAAVA